MADPRVHEVGIILNGVTGRMGTNQHLLRSIVPIIRDGGVRAGDDRIIPVPVLVGRNEAKLEALAKRAGLESWTTDLDVALADRKNSIYFDAQTTDSRHEDVSRAIAAGKHVYCEKPVAGSLGDALDLCRRAAAACVRSGVVQDKLWLPGLVKLRRTLETGVIGRILSIRGEFGYWVFEGDEVPAQRPSWNYRKEDGGGIVLDMFAHWRYVLDNLFGNVRSVSCIAATHIPMRWDEAGKSYDCTAEDAAYATFEIEGGAIAHFNSSWAVRVRRDDLLTIQVDGTEGSAVAGLRRCFLQPAAATPRPVWNPDAADLRDYRADWIEVPDQEDYPNAFRAQWELFLRHAVLGDPFPWSLLEGAKGVQLAELGLESWRRRAVVDVPELTVG
jgi:predicted dehydrogenase